MGFPLEQATIALRAAFGDVSRAAEYLFNPSSMPAMPAMAAAAAPAATGGVAATPAASGTAVSLFSSFFHVSEYLTNLIMMFYTQFLHLHPQDII